jgi:uncharacterized protein with HEPN domain
MSERKPSQLIRDVLTSIERITLYTQGLSFENFIANYMVVEACLYNIQIIGEAVSKLPEDIKKSEPTIPWLLIKGMRNRLIHEYFGTNTTIVWQVIKKELPEITKDLEKILKALIDKDR